MEAILDYKIISGDKSSEIMDRVKDSIQKGWQPYGSLQMNSDSDGVWYAQAIVLYGSDLPRQIREFWKLRSTE